MKCSTLFIFFNVDLNDLHVAAMPAPNGDDVENNHDNDDQERTNDENKTINDAKTEMTIMMIG